MGNILINIDKIPSTTEFTIHAVEVYDCNRASALWTFWDRDVWDVVQGID